MGSGVFMGCYKQLNTINIPAGLSVIPKEIFMDCPLMSIVIPETITAIGDTAFHGCEELTEVYYEGTEEKWNILTIGYNNDFLISATRYYYSESQPTTSGNYWHYVNGVPTKW